MPKNAMPTETTDSILDFLQKDPRENIIIHLGGSLYLVPTATVKSMLWNAIPDFIKDEKSEEAKKMSLVRTGIKGLIRPLLPTILLKTWGQEVSITPGLNILTWLPKYFTHYFVAFLASKEWQVHEQHIEERVYKIVAISPYTDNSGDARALTTTSADSEPVQGRTELDAHRSEDSHIT